MSELEKQDVNSTTNLSPRDLETRQEKIRTKESKARKIKASQKKKRIQDSYKHTLKLVQAELSTTSRLFSKLIHNDLIDSATEFIGKTIARPNAILFGSVMAFIFTLSTYLIAKNSGYELSGFETIASFALGWTVGVLYDYIKLLISGKKL